MTKISKLLEEEGYPVGEIKVIVPQKSNGLFDKTTFAKAYTAQEIRFVQILCDPEHQPNKEYDFNDRLTQARISADADELQLDDRIKALIHYYLSHYLNNNKYQQLVSKQIQLWNLHRLALDDMTPDKDVIEMHRKITELIDSLTDSIEALEEKIYMSPEIKEIAKEEIKNTLSPEKRLKRRQ